MRSEPILRWFHNSNNPMAPLVRLLPLETALRFRRSLCWSQGQRAGRQRDWWYCRWCLGEWAIRQSACDHMSRRKIAACYPDCQILLGMHHVPWDARPPHRIHSWWPTSERSHHRDFECLRMPDVRWALSRFQKREHPPFPRQLLRDRFSLSMRATMVSTCPTIYSHLLLRLQQRISPDPKGSLGMPASMESSQNDSAVDLNRSNHDFPRTDDEIHRHQHFLTVRSIHRLRCPPFYVAAVEVLAFSEENQINLICETFLSIRLVTNTYLFEFLAEWHSIKVIGIGVRRWRTVHGGSQYMFNSTNHTKNAFCLVMNSKSRQTIATEFLDEWTPMLNC